MLILTRRTNESIIIIDSDNNTLAQIVVTNIDKNQVKLGINTSVDSKIWRSELYERMYRKKIIYKNTTETKVFDLNNADVTEENGC